MPQLYYIWIEGGGLISYNLVQMPELKRRLCHLDELLDRYRRLIRGIFRARAFHKAISNLSSVLNIIAGDINLSRATVFLKRVSYTSKIFKHVIRLESSGYPESSGICWFLAVPCIKRMDHLDLHLYLITGLFMMFNNSSSNVWVKVSKIYRSNLVNT